LEAAAAALVQLAQAVMLAETAEVELHHLLLTQA
jgi:hypothetical protein